MGRVKRLYVSVLVALAALALTATAAFAAVVPNFDADGNFDGTGFVGKGDVQLAYGWNNKQLQSNLSQVNFDYIEREESARSCKQDGDPDTRGPQWVYTSTTHVTDVNSVVQYDTRNNKKGDITGFNLTGFGATSNDSVVTDENGNVITVEPSGCPAGWQPDGGYQDLGSSAGLFTNSGSYSLYTF